MAAAARDFYVQVVGLDAMHGGDEYEQLFHNGELVMQLHDREPDVNHDAIADPKTPVGNGVLVWFEVADFDAAVDRVAAFGCEIVRDVAINPNAKQQEIWVRDPTGYTVVLAGPSEYRPRT